MVSADRTKPTQVTNCPVDIWFLFIVLYYIYFHCHSKSYTNIKGKLNHTLTSAFFSQQKRSLFTGPEESGQFYFPRDTSNHLRNTHPSKGTITACPLPVQNEWLILCASSVGRTQFSPQLWVSCVCQLWNPKPRAWSLIQECFSICEPLYIGSLTDHTFRSCLGWNKSWNTRNESIIKNLNQYCPVELSVMIEISRPVLFNMIIKHLKCNQFLVYFS